MCMGINIIGTYSAFGYITAIVAGIFIAFVLQLLIFHTVLMGKNVTTWEFLSWKKISYLSEWPKKNMVLHGISE